MAINKGTLAKRVDGILEIIYPKTSGDMVMLESGARNLNEVLTDLKDNKVDKITGKGLSTEDFTTALKTKLEGLDNTLSNARVSYADEAGEVAWSHVSGKPNTFAPSAHNHSSSDITDLSMAHVAEADSAPWSGISDKPTAFTPASHTHNSADIISLDASKLTGIIPIERLPKAAVPTLVRVLDSAARFALTIDDIQKGDTVKQMDTDKMYYVVDDTKLNTEEGYEPYTAGAASSVPWSGVTGKPSTYPPSAHTHSIANITDIGDASVANAEKVNNHTVASDVPNNAKFTDTIYTHPTNQNYSSGLYKITVDSLGHVVSAVAVEKGDITALGIPASNTTYQGTNGEISLSNGKFGLASVTPNNTTATGSPKFGQTLSAVTDISVDTKGRVTGKQTTTYTLPVTTLVNYTMEASKWNDNKYTFTEYPATKYRIDILTAESMTRAQYAAVSNAKMLGSLNGNYVTCIGVTPQIDIPVMLQITQFS